MKLDEDNRGEPVKRPRAFLRGYPEPRAMLAVARRLLSAAQRAGVPAAIGGGLAMQVYGSPRLTKDVDVIATEPSPRPGRPLGIGGTSFRVGTVPVDWIYRCDHYATLYAEAARKAVRVAGLRVVRPEYLAVMKLAAMRPKDHDDLIYLLENGPNPRRLARAAMTLARRLLGAYAADDLLSFVLEAAWRRRRGGVTPVRLPKPKRRLARRARGAFGGRA